MWFDILLYLSNINNVRSAPTLWSDPAERKMYDFGRLKALFADLCILWLCLVVWFYEDVLVRSKKKWKRVDLVKAIESFRSVT